MGSLFVVDERGRSYFKYAGQPNLKGPILAFNGDRNEDSLLESEGMQVCGVLRRTLELKKAKGALLCC